MILLSLLKQNIIDIKKEAEKRNEKKEKHKIVEEEEN